MAVLEQLVRTARAWRASLFRSTALNPSFHRAREFRRRFCRGTFEQSNSDGKEVWRSYNTPNDFRPLSMAPVVWGAFFSVGVVSAESFEADDGSPLPKESSSSYADLEHTAKKERQRIEELLRSKGMRYGSYPRFNVAVKGQKVTFKFQIPPTCEVAQLIANIVAQLGLKVEERAGGSDMLLRAWDSSVAWQLTLGYPQSKKGSGWSEVDADDRNADEDLCILIFGSLISSDKVEIEFIKKGSLTPAELEAFGSALRLAGTQVGQNKESGRKTDEGKRVSSVDKSISQLESMGVRIYGVSEPVGNSLNQMSWENIAGYHQQKREIEDTILMSLRRPEVYDDIVHGTRSKFESNRPRAVLFEGPPGTGKTSCARVIANQAGIPLLYVPLEAVMSKFYGESERLLGTVFSLANELSDGGAIIFLDEIDAFAISRDSEMHEATRRVLSVLLRQIDGFEQDKKVVVIAATNRKQDLDPALISRFDSMITFGLPDERTRQEIIAQYAKQLTKPELVQLAQATEAMSGRDVRDVCQRAERTWASKLIRGQAKSNGEQVSLPPLHEYLDSAEARRKALLSVTEQREQNRNTRSKKPLLDFQ